MRTPLSAAVAIIVGLLILAGYFFPFSPLLSLKNTLVQWAMILAGFALLVGVVNLIKVHWLKIRKRSPGSVYSLILIISLAVTIVVAGYFGPAASSSLWIFKNIQLPVEMSLLALMSILLIYVVTRLLRRRPDSVSILFIATVFLVLLGTAPLFFIGEVRVLSVIRNFIVQVPAVAGARGILLGVALGAIATGIRILTGADRPYGG